jgi:hypothetical protein
MLFSDATAPERCTTANKTSRTRGPGLIGSSLLIERCLEARLAPGGGHLDLSPPLFDPFSRTLEPSWLGAQFSDNGSDLADETK